MQPFKSLNSRLFCWKSSRVAVAIRDAVEGREMTESKILPDSYLLSGDFWGGECYLVLR